MSRRRFSAKALEARLDAFARRCAMCRCEIDGKSGLEWDHHIPLAIGGDDAVENLQPLCRGCHRLKTGGDATRKAKMDRQRQKNVGIRTVKRRLPGSRDSNIKIRMDGRAVDRRTGQPIGGAR